LLGVVGSLVNERVVGDQNLGAVAEHIHLDLQVILALG
jgi:hypothetical protein